MFPVAVTDPRVLVLVDEETPGARSQAAGHLFEDFFAKLLTFYGFVEPTDQAMRSTSHGFEVDLRVRHKLTRQLAMAECKAYGTPVPASALNEFYGKLTSSRLTESDIYGFFVALPRLTAQGEEQARHIAEADSRFSYVNAARVVAELEEAEILRARPLGRGVPTSDPAVLVTEHGVFGAAIELDAQTRIGVRVVAWASAGAVPAPVLEMLAAREDYGPGLPVADAPSVTEHGPYSVQASLADLEPVVATVVGSTEDFEYQFPASPRFFLGRQAAIREFGASLDGGSRVFVLNAQSGWGKSSLALRLKQEVEQRGGYSLVVDSRTASARGYLTSVLRRAGQEASDLGLLELPRDRSWASLGSILRTFSAAKWKSDARIVVFFDQFENVFRDEQLTREFRDLALGVREMSGPLYVGFAWKTDLVAWTEDHPYQMRDDIRDGAAVINLAPFDARDVNTLVRRLEKKLNQTLAPDLKQRLREYSQGLPWLLKKLAGHLIREISTGATQEQLLARALNVQNLFEADLAELQPAEHEALRFVAKFAPVAAAEVTERAAPAVVEALVHRRLLVQVGSRLDTYWDIFRDFLNTGRIPIEDSYILRQGPRAVARIMSIVGAEGGDAPVPTIVKRLGTSENAVFNLARELRLLGVTAYEPNRVRVLEEIWNAPDREQALRHRVSTSLRRHRAYSALVMLSERSGGRTTLAAYARELPAAFPAVEVSESTWLSYARAFAGWFQYAGFVRLVDQSITPRADDDAVEERLLGTTPRIRLRGAFPQTPPGPALEILRLVESGEVRVANLAQNQSRPLQELVVLGVVEVLEDGRIRQTAPPVLLDGQPDREALRDRLEERPGMTEAFAMLSADSSTPPQELGLLIRSAYGADWSPGTQWMVGKNVRGWARAVGLPTSQRRSRPAEPAGHPKLFPE